jgi:uncharacterized membrane protein YeiH
MKDIMRDELGAPKIVDRSTFQAELLSLVPAPTFAIMAALTASHGGSMSDVLCSAALNESPLIRMSLMYVLMSVFHLAPWLNLLSRRSVAARRS